MLEKYWRTDFKRYVEPFAGCAALFFRLQPSKAVLGDLNSDLIEVYEVLRSNPDKLFEAVTSYPTGEDHYYRVRAQIPTKLSDFRRAARFVYLNRHCFNGIYRTNLAGQFNVPFGGKKSGAIPPIEAFRKCALLLTNVRLVSSDFGKVLSSTRAGDFVYMDPPYAVETRRIFRQYGPREFTSKDLKRLSLHLSRMNERGVHFVASYADCAAARAAFQDWHPKRVKVKRNVAGFAGARRFAYELLASNIEL